MKKKFNNVYQFKITLLGINPPIWRKIQAPETYTFWDLHVALQDAMGWYDYHLHEFEMVNPRTDSPVNIGTPYEDSGSEILPEEKQKIADYFSMENPSAHYVYDFGDSWEHEIRLEKIIPREKIDYPVCIKGKRACPPEDCGGVWGYEEFLEIIKDPDHEEYEDMLEWVGGAFDPEHFDVKEIVFDDPAKRRRMILE
ncbi:MAG: plasmid pRiA4b ORF-3 family protein [Theionarchaea archaeon]|nr:MAG: hypothetical protein AYK19_00745 [Theionarchaea archaeon DG-70-1]MBU7029097.1 plasmid pRiA4b ORF-3 family protein [Theionarchaea archaeon]